jgi:DNA sulfur modification protein DndD
MIIRHLRLRDFRQFKGNQSIDFASNDRGGGRNVTVVFGENGRGKTGLYRAILFALYGDTRLNQDDDISGSEVRLVNAQLVSESGERQAVEAIVELQFEERGDVYTVIRKRIAAKRGRETIEDPGPVVLRILDSDGNTRVIEDEVVIRSEIESILDPRVKDYYLFDGERMDRLTRAGSSQRREIAKGIRNLLNIDALETATIAMERVTAKLVGDLNKASSVSYARVLLEVEACQDKIRQSKLQIEKLESEISLADDEIAKIDGELEDFQEIRELVTRRQDYAKRREQRITERTTFRLNLSNTVSRSAMLLVRQSLQAVFDKIESIRNRGELPAEIRRDLIDRILARDMCICGRPVIDNSVALASIRAWLEKTAEESIEDSALRLWQQIAGILTHFDDYEREIEGHVQLYGNATNDILEYGRQLEEIALKIGGSERKDASALDSHRAEADRKRISLMAERMTTELKLRESKSKLEQLNAQRDEEEAKNAKQDEFSQRVALARRVVDALNAVSARFTAQIRERLALLASDALSHLLDRASQANICTLRITDSYTIELFNKYGDPWLAQISAGQRQVLSIAFIAALAEAASNGHLLEMPLFMDTPFGRLGSVHRENLMKLVPNKAAQWVLLATDTEFRSNEALLLEETGRWGKLYFLEDDSTGNTLIEERPSTAVAFNAYVRDRATG